MRRRAAALVLCLLIAAAAAALAVGATGGSPRPTTVASARIAAGHARTVALRHAADAVALRVRRRCGAGATVRLAIDGRPVMRRRVTSRTWRTLTVATTVRAGRRRLALGVSGGRSRGCRRPLALGAVRLLDGATTAPATSTPLAPVGGAGTDTPPAEAPASTPGASATDPATSPAAPAATPSGAKLAWAPPALTAPTTVYVAQGDQTVTLDTTKDYILKLGAATHAGGLNIKGGRNVVLVGGRIALPTTSTRATAIGISGTVGTVHVEGVWIDGSSGHETDGIQISAPRATVQLENLRVTGLRGSYDTNHTDVIQPWGGVAKLRVDRLTGSTNYQGIFDKPDQGAIGPVDLRHIDLSYDNVGARTGGYLIWLTDGCTAATSTTFTDVYVKGRTGSSLGSTVWPPTGAATTCPASVAGTLATWPRLPVVGGVRWGAPPGGSFVTAGDAGTTYASPGYG